MSVTVYSACIGAVCKSRLGSHKQLNFAQKSLYKVNVFINFFQVFIPMAAI